MSGGAAALGGPRSGWIRSVLHGRRVAPHIVFLVLGGLNALVLTVLTPPFQVHDEFQHFFRSYQLSEGRLWSQVWAARAGDWLPASLPAFVGRRWGTLGIWTSPPLRPRPLWRTLAEGDRALAPEVRAFADFSGAAFYAPLPYLPQAAAIAVGRAAHASPLSLLYLGRVANAVVAIGLIALALRLLPYGRWPAMTAAMLPMAQYEYGSVAPDPLIIACAYLFTALAVRAAVGVRWSRAGAVAAAAAGSVFCAIKIVYAPLLVLGLPVGGAAAGRAARSQFAFWATQLAIAAVAVAAFLLWFRSSMDTMLLIGAGQKERVAEILASPLRQFQLIGRDLWEHGRFYGRDLVGIFGAANIPLPAPAYQLAAFALLLSVLCERSTLRLRPAQLLWAALLLLACCGAIETALSIFATPPHPTVITGVQGRYFLPLGALAGVVAASLTPAAKAPVAPRAVLAALLAVLTLTMDWTLAQHFAVFAAD